MSSRARVFALCGLAALLALGAGFMLLSGGQPSSSAATVIKPLHAISTRRRLGSQRHARAMLRRHTVDRRRKATPRQVVKPSLKRTVKRAAPRVIRPRPAIGSLPGALAAALAKHAVVVVALVSPQASVDQLSLGEAQAGAARAGAGFLVVSTANEPEVSALTTLVSASQAPTNRLLDSPAVLVFQRPDTLFVRFNGFADRQTVEQAAANARGSG